MKITLGEQRVGPAGEATQLLHELNGDDPPDKQATIASWFLRCPGQSPAWDRYLLSGIHLRDIPGVPPAHVRVGGATHEVMLLALDPGKDPVPTDPETWRFLRPYNLMEQVHLDDDGQLVELLAAAAQAVVDGVLWAEAPLSGQVEPWRTVLIKSAAHLRGEEHAP